MESSEQVPPVWRSPLSRRHFFKWGVATSMATLGLGALADSSAAQRTTSLANSCDRLDLVGLNAQGYLSSTIRYPNGSWDPFRSVERQTGVPGSFIDADLSGDRNRESIYNLCGVTNDGHLWHTIRRGSWGGSWDPFRDVTTYTGDRGYFLGVGIAQVFPTLHVCGVTDDGELWHTIRHANGRWDPFGNVKAQAGYPGSFFDVACTVIYTGDLHVCGVTDDGELWHTIRHANGRWDPFGNVKAQAGYPGFFVATACAITEYGDLHLSGTTSDGNLWLTIRHSDGSWDLFGDVKRQAGDRGFFVTTACTYSDFGFHLSGTTSDGHLWHTIRHSDGRWDPFGDVVTQAGYPDFYVNVAIAVVSTCSRL